VRLGESHLANDFAHMELSAYISERLSKPSSISTLPCGETYLELNITLELGMAISNCAY